MNESNNTSSKDFWSCFRRVMPIVRVVKLLDFIANDIIVFPLLVMCTDAYHDFAILSPWVAAVIVFGFALQFFTYNLSEKFQGVSAADVFLGLSWAAVALLTIWGLVMSVIESRFNGLLYAYIPAILLFTSAPFVGCELALILRHFMKPRNRDTNPSKQ
ncbi:MAG: hypothetical protein II794_08565 [Oscillospiraceae bacterium]|nr:hypothetical protein [Oscillospiraceae bacterium]